MMAFSGVRSSWLMLARKRDLPAADPRPRRAPLRPPRRRPPLRRVPRSGGARARARFRARWASRRRRRPRRLGLALQRRSGAAAGESATRRRPPDRPRRADAATRRSGWRSPAGRTVVCRRRGREPGQGGAEPRPAIRFGQLEQAIRQRGRIQSAGGGRTPPRRGPRHPAPAARCGRLGEHRFEPGALRARGSQAPWSRRQQGPGAASAQHQAEPTADKAVLACPAAAGAGRPANSSRARRGRRRQPAARLAGAMPSTAPANSGGRQQHQATGPGDAARQAAAATTR